MQTLDKLVLEGHSEMTSLEETPHSHENCHENNNGLDKNKNKI